MNSARLGFWIPDSVLRSISSVSAAISCRTVVFLHRLISEDGLMMMGTLLPTRMKTPSPSFIDLGPVPIYPLWVRKNFLPLDAQSTAS
ncbi:hypothetical protein M406DRAFT_354851 [Cryphonectria parasitica EP155]|uniref:Uncharacterized protein n=1 Tax=Cryphonectria parasitica (strain ATCC 38755 / EP155) TaxID=660469 RepID=A0A9P4YDA6_CRYP1|nr:uncharacterized protein M406DRAFT_354851 [Cryphonectria parasitica EP155]KAF3771414.1 hypothetical protein M406DRAFT_354851 [Cryphonectria parasitica EP155]